MQQDDLQCRRHHAQRAHQLQDAGVEAAFLGGGVFGEVDRRAADFATDRQALQHAQEEQQRRRQQADLFVGGQQADQYGRGAHQHDGGEKDGTPAVAVAERAEDRGAERADDHADAEGAEAGEQRRDRVVGREEQHAEIGGQRREGQEVVPLEKGAETGGDDDFLLNGFLVFWAVHGRSVRTKGRIIAASPDAVEVACRLAAMRLADGLLRSTRKTAKNRESLSARAVGRIRRAA